MDKKLSVTLDHVAGILSIARALARQKEDSPNFQYELKLQEDGVLICVSYYINTKSLSGEVIKNGFKLSNQHTFSWAHLVEVSGTTQECLYTLRALISSVDTVQDENLVGRPIADLLPS